MTREAHDSFWEQVYIRATGTWTRDGRGSTTAVRKEHPVRLIPVLGLITFLLGIPIPAVAQSATLVVAIAQHHGEWGLRGPGRHWRTITVAGVPRHREPDGRPGSRLLREQCPDLGRDRPPARHGEPRGVAAFTRVGTYDRPGTILDHRTLRYLIAHGGPRRPVQARPVCTKDRLGHPNQPRTVHLLDHMRPCPAPTSWSAIP